MAGAKFFAANWNDRRFRKTFEKFHNYTMVPDDVYAGNLELALRVEKVAGAIVECGTWRGGMIAGIADVLGPGRQYYLFDSFEGLPPVKEIDGEAALAWSKNVEGPDYHDNCRASEEEAKRCMKMSAAKDYLTVKGWFEATLPSAGLGPIALLRLDADWYDSTKQILDNLGRLVVPGGLVVVDDYYTWDGCTRAVNEYAAVRNWKIRQHTRGGICYILV